MSVILHPDINDLDTEDLLYIVYQQLYSNFFNAQIKKDAEHPYGIVEGDESSIRLRNTAFGFADVIASAVSFGGGNGGGTVLLDYLKKSGGDMTGALRSNFGFEAGIKNSKILETFYKPIFDEDQELLDERYGVRISGDLHIGGNNLYIDGKQFISYNALDNVLSISTAKINFSSAIIQSSGELLFGNNITEGVYISSSTIQLKGNEVYHAGNANNMLIDWRMLNGTVNGKLLVEGQSDLRGYLKASAGVELGIAGKILFAITTSGIHVNDHMNFSKKIGIKFNDLLAISSVNEKDVQIGATGGQLFLGNEKTNKIRLFTGISDVDNEYLLLSKYGAAYFPDSLAVRHNFGDLILSSYRVNSNDEGIVIHKKLRFGRSNGTYLYGVDKGIGLVSSVEHITSATNTKELVSYETEVRHAESTSFYKPMNRFTDTFLISTQADFIATNKPLEAKGHIGLDQSFTRLTDGTLLFNSSLYLQAGVDGIKHYGNAYFTANVGSVKFASGFAGYGWSIMDNKTTGNVSATFDELTVRKKMRIYELEVQKISATNGSLWVSDNCGGDTVIKL